MTEKSFIRLVPQLRAAAIRAGISAGVGGDAAEDVAQDTVIRLWQMCDDLERYIYACLLCKTCCVCGKRAELHHVDRIGMGNDRTKVNHIGRRCLPLCREHHMEVDQIGDEALCARYHVEPVKIDARIAKTYKLHTKRVDRDAKQNPEGEHLHV